MFVRWRGWSRHVLGAAPYAFMALAQIPLRAQDTTAVSPPAVTPLKEQREEAPACIEPPPLFRWEDYEGPFAKTVGVFGRKLERKTVQRHYKPGTIYCSLEPREKLVLFFENSVDPVSILAAGFNSGLDQASNRDPTFGQGGAGYARRFGADFASQTAARFFGDFLYPTVFSEDPRYYRMGQGSKRARLLHAVSHTIIAHRDNGTPAFNFTEWLGTASSVALSNVYHPGNQPGAAAAARNGAFVVLEDMGFDVLREFWPEVARKFRMPFRAVRQE